MPCPGNVVSGFGHKGLGTQQIEGGVGSIISGGDDHSNGFRYSAGKAAMSDMIHRLETGKIDILIGTQMVSKGLDFENIGLVP
ncbi:MAG: hypothetical protein IPO45_09265 [Saprospiraceae bacterium]|nr:hypothetical protein [Candidatus Brachybacter algidus]